MYFRLSRYYKLISSSAISITYFSGLITNWKWIAITCAASFVEQVSHNLRWAVERAYRQKHSAQGLDCTCWSWVKYRITGRQLSKGKDVGSPQLVRHGKQWWLHTPVEKTFSSPPKGEEQITTHAQTRICAVDLNLDGIIAVCTIQTAEGSILATRFIGGGQAVSGTRRAAAWQDCTQPLTNRLTRSG
jgi:hypothetical protein